MFKKNLSRDYEKVTDLNKAHKSFRGVEQTNRICRIAVLPRPARYRRYDDAPARRTSVSRSLRWDNDRNPHARSATASRWGSLTRRNAPHPLKLILAASFCRRGRGAVAICERVSPIGSQTANGSFSQRRAAARFRSRVQSIGTTAIPYRCAHCSVTGGTHPAYRFRLPRANRVNSASARDLEEPKES